MPESEPQTVWAFRDRQGNPCLPKCVLCHGISEDGTAHCSYRLPGEDYAYTYTVLAGWIRPTFEEAKAAALEAAEDHLVKTARLIGRIASL